MSEKVQQKVGLEHLSDEKLAEMVEQADIHHDGSLKTPEARLAFMELARRSGHEV
jgi:hypothetical protein